MPVKSGVKLLYIAADLAAFSKTGISTLGNFCTLRIGRSLPGINDDVIVVASNVQKKNNDSRKWQGRKDSNLRMAGSKPAALPLGDAPVVLANFSWREADCRAAIYLRL